MGNVNKLNKFIDTVCSNSAAVLQTITNQQISIDKKQTSGFDFDLISSQIEIPGILLTVNFSKDETFQMSIFINKTLVAALADLMMLGDGEVEYNPEEHNDALQEMFNQVLGSVTAELSGEGISLNGVVNQVELTDMDIQREFMADNTMAEVNFEMMGKEQSMFFLLDSDAMNSIDSLYVGFEEESAAKQTPAADNQKSAPVNEEPAVSVSRASFQEMKTEQSFSGQNKNIDMLLDVVLPITVELGRKNMRIKQILDLGQGSVVELNKTAGEPVDLLVNGKKFAVGEVMVADENYAVRIINLISRADRIKSLGEDDI